MSAKDILFGREAQSLVKEGVDKLANAVKATLGPRGRNVLIEKTFGAPVVTVADAHPHSLAWVGGALRSKIIPLGVSDWGQSGNRDELYREYGTDVESIVKACISALD